MRSDFKIKKLGVHGYSLGGSVACHLAKFKKIEFLFADRTYSSLSRVTIR